MRRRAPLLAVIMATVAGLAFSPLNRVDLGNNAAFIPALFTAIFLIELMTAYLLWQQFEARGEISLIGLSLTYLFTGLLMIPYALTYPFGVGAKGVMGGTPSSSSWFWLLWHIALPMGLAISLGPWPRQIVVFVRRNHTKFGRRSAAVVVLVAASVGLLLRGGMATVPWLGGVLDYPRMARIFGPYVVGISLLSLVVVCARSTKGQRLERWIVIAAAATAADALLTVGAGARFTAGWYLGRALALTATGVVLVALSREIGKMYREMLRSNRELKEQNERDALTGVYSRRAILERADALLDGPGIVAIGVLDLDHFKAVNDSYGHSVGDEVLVWVARRMEGCLRAGDAVGRLGGEEFVVLFPGAGAEAATRAAERIRRALSDSTISTAGGHVRITASLGIATQRSEDQVFSTVLDRADRALYAAKSAGRNQVMSSDDRKVLVGS